MRNKNELTKENIPIINAVVEKTSQFQIQKLEQMKKKLPRYLKKRKEKFADEYIRFVEDNTMNGILVPDETKLPMYSIIQHTFSPVIKIAGVSPAYSADEFAIAFDFYKECSEVLNKTGMYTPKIEDFCSLINISRNTFDKYQQTSPDENLREVCEKIKDYCVARTSDLAMGSKDKSVVTYAMFQQRSSNKQRDNDPVQNNTYIQNNNIMTDEQFNDLAKKCDFD